MGFQGLLARMSQFKGTRVLYVGCSASGHRLALSGSSSPTACAVGVSVSGLLFVCIRVERLSAEGRGLLGFRGEGVHVCVCMCVGSGWLKG